MQSDLDSLFTSLHLRVDKLECALGARFGRGRGGGKTSVFRRVMDRESGANARFEPSMANKLWMCLSAYVDNDPDVSIGKSDGPRIRVHDLMGKFKRSDAESGGELSKFLMRKTSRSVQYAYNNMLFKSWNLMERNLSFPIRVMLLSVILLDVYGRNAGVTVMWLERCVEGMTYPNSFNLGHFYDYMTARTRSQSERAVRAIRRQLINL